MQTTKARARRVNISTWLVTHADTPVTAFSPMPHDAAAMLIKMAVLDAQLGVPQCAHLPPAIAAT